MRSELLKLPPLCRYVKVLMRDAGLSIREDAMGNIYGRMAGSSSTGTLVLTAYLAL